MNLKKSHMLIILLHYNVCLIVVFMLFFQENERENFVEKVVQINIALRIKNYEKA